HPPLHPPVQRGRSRQCLTRLAGGKMVLHSPVQMKAGRSRPMQDVRVSFPRPCSEKWDEMSPSGCNRHCDRCDKIIHDLERLTLDEAEALLRSESEVCVRAKLDAEGAIQLKASRKPRVGRLVAASIGMLAMAAPATAAKPEPSRVIVGHDTSAYFKTKVT